MAENELAPIPSKLPDPQKPQYTPAINNLAGDKELVAKLLPWIRDRFNHYDGQSARTEMMKDDGTLDLCDRMWRMSSKMYDEDRQLLNRHLLSNLPSSVFYRNVKNRISLHLMGMIPRDDADLPAEYVLAQGNADYSDEDGKAIAEQANAWEHYVFENDDRYRTIVKGIHWQEIYGLQIWGEEWAHRKERLPQKKVTRWEGEAVKLPVAFAVTDELVTTYEGPARFLVDAKDFWCNADIDGEQLQDNICVIRRARITNSRLIAEHKLGLLLNLDQVGAEHLFLDDQDSANDPESARRVNAGESSTPEKSGLYLVWYVDHRVPIKEGKNGKGEWDPKGTETALYRSVWAGRMGRDMVCLQIVRRANLTDRFPYTVTYSHTDNKGFYHGGWGTMLCGSYWQSCKNRNQLVDGIDLIQQAPWIIDGSMLSGDMTWSPDKLNRISPGSKLQQPRVNDASNAIKLAQDSNDEDVAKTVGIVGPLAMVQAKSHTPATDVKMLNEHAMRPIEMDTSEIADTLYFWMFHGDYQLTTVFADPKLTLSVTHLNKLISVTPCKLWGPLNVKVRIVTEYYETQSRRGEILALMNGSSFPLIYRTMGEQGQKIFCRKVFKLFRYLGDCHDEIFPMKLDYDARNRAQNENYAMLDGGQWAPVSPNDNHDVHIPIHDGMERQQAFLPEDIKAPEDRINMLRAHKLQHEQFRTEAAAAIAQSMGGGAPGQGQGPQGMGEKLLEGVSGQGSAEGGTPGGAI